MNVTEGVRENKRKMIHNAPEAKKTNASYKTWWYMTACV